MSKDARTEDERNVLQFFDDWARSDASLLAQYFTDDAVYADIGEASRERGRTNIATYLANLFDRCSLKIETLHIASRDGIIFSERVDYIRMKSGRTSDIQVVGVMEMRAGKISRWYDYADQLTFRRDIFGDRETDE
jgi:limonene-1,2-epoxide hydrolase